MSSRDILMCVPPLRGLYVELAKRSLLAGVPIMLTCTSRDFMEQVALYAQGRESLIFVNEKRRKVRLPPISAAQNMYCVTWTLDSKHIVGHGRLLSEAFDIAVIKNKIVYWDIKADVDADGVPDYLEVARIGRELGLVCGADFTKIKNNKRIANPDYPHFEIPSTLLKEAV